MAPSPFFHTDARVDRISEAPPPLVLEGSGSANIPASWPSGFSPSRSWQNLVSRIPPQLRTMSGYLVAGVALGLVLIVALSLMSDGGRKKASAGLVTDDVVRLHARDIGETCWRGSANATMAKLTVAIEVGLDGKVRSASANGDSPVMRTCVETHVKAWEFLPQANPSQMVLPFEVDPR